MARYSFNLAEIGRSLSAPLVVVMPIYNEEANIRHVIEQWAQCFRELGLSFQLIALDDGSSDLTHSILTELEATMPEMLCVVSKPNAGHGVTCRIGYDIAVLSETEWILQIDSDGQCEPRHFADFWDGRDNFDCIFGIRTIREDGLGRILTSTICRLASSLICGQDLKDANVPYRLIRRGVLQQALRYIPPSFNIHNVALTYVLKKLPGLCWKYVPIHFPNRIAGATSLNLLKVTTWGADMLLELLRLRGRLSKIPNEYYLADDTSQPHGNPKPRLSESSQKKGP